MHRVRLLHCSSLHENFVVALHCSSFFLLGLVFFLLLFLLEEYVTDCVYDRLLFR